MTTERKQLATFNVTYQPSTHRRLRFQQTYDSKPTQRTLFWQLVRPPSRSVPGQSRFSLPLPATRLPCPRLSVPRISGTTTTRSETPCPTHTLIPPRMNLNVGSPVVENVTERKKGTEADVNTNDVVNSPRAFYDIRERSQSYTLLVFS